MFISDEKREWFDSLLTILNEIDRVCKENEITYWIAFGTLIGAVRHKGFIPWDDDVDLLMKRDQYEKFRRVCPKSLSAGFSYQTTYNETGYYRYVARVRNDNTTLITKNDLQLLNAGIEPKYNMGIFISIFPLDTLPNNRLLAKAQDILSEIRHKILVSAIYNTEGTFKSKVCKAYSGLMGYKNIFSRLENSFARYSRKPGKYLRIPEKIEGPNCTFHSEDFDETCYLEFEGKLYPAPKGYDRVLRTTYGDYMKIPPIEHQITKHSEYSSTKEGYREYILRRYKYHIPV